MTTKRIQIRLEHGLEARPVALLVQEASKYDSIIYIQSGDKRVNAKSIMGIMGLGLDPGKTVTIEVTGEDEEEAITAISEFLEK